MRRLLSSVDYNDTPTHAENDKQLKARLSQRMRDTKPTAIATARLADESGRRTPGGRPIARDPVGRRRLLSSLMPHPCARQTTNAPNQTPCHRTQTAPPTHLRMRRAKTTIKHNTTNNKQTHHHRNAPDGTLLAAPTLTQPAKPRRIPRRDQRGRNTQTAKNTNKTPTTRRNTPNHHAHAHTTDTNQSAPLPLPPRRTPKRAPSTGEAHASKHVRGAPNAHARNHAPPRKRREIP